MKRKSLFIPTIYLLMIFALTISLYLARRAYVNYNISENGTTKCPKCGAEIRPHRVCTECGTYKGKDVVKSKEETAK